MFHCVPLLIVGLMMLLLLCVGARGMGFNPIDFEAEAERSEPVKGVRRDRNINIFSELTSSAGVALNTTAAATPFKAVTNTSIPIVRWRQDAAATDFALWSGTVPGEYSTFVDDLCLDLLLRKNDSSTDENADLAMQVMARWWTPGVADPTIAAATVPVPTAGDAALVALPAVVKRTLAAPVNATVAGFAWHRFDLSLGVARGLTDALREGARIAPLDQLILEIGPDDTVGTTNMTVDLAGAFLRWRTGFNLNTRASRLGTTI